MAEEKDEAIVVEEGQVEDKKKARPGAYLIMKRDSDKKWIVKIVGSDKVIKTFDTKAEAVAFTKDRAERSGRGTVAKASKGAKVGKFQKVK